MDFLYASAEVHTLPPRKRLGNVLRDVAHSPTDLGSKKARLAGEAYVRAALCDPRLVGKSLREIAAEESGSFLGDDSDVDGNSKSFKKKGRNASSSSLTANGGEKTEKKKKKLTTKSERSTTPVLVGDDETTSTGEPKEMTDEEMAMKLHLEMNASPRMSRGSSRSTQMLAGRALFN